VRLVLSQAVDLNLQKCFVASYRYIVDHVDGLKSIDYDTILTDSSLNFDMLLILKCAFAIGLPTMVLTTGH